MQIGIVIVRADGEDSGGNVSGAFFLQKLQLCMYNIYADDEDSDETVCMHHLP